MLSLEAYLQARYQVSTARSYGREIRVYLSAMPSGCDATYLQIVAYVGSIRARYSPRSLHRIVCCIKVYYRYLVYSGQRADNPARSLRLKDKPTQDIQLQDLFSKSELEALLEIEQPWGVTALRNRVLMSLLVYQGLEPIEVSGLRMSDIDLAGGSIYVAASGSTNARRLPLQARQVYLFDAYMRQTRPVLLSSETTSTRRSEADKEAFVLSRRGTVYAREDVTKYVLRVYKGWYVPRKVTAEKIRQSVIANLLKEGADLRVVQAFCGHKQLSSTERYKQSHLDELEAAIVRLHPMA